MGESTTDDEIDDNICIVKEIRCTPSSTEKYYHIFHKNIELTEISESDIRFIQESIEKLISAK